MLDYKPNYTDVMINITNSSNEIASNRNSSIILDNINVTVAASNI